jgi:hypothetical protein
MTSVPRSRRRLDSLWIDRLNRHEHKPVRGFSQQLRATQLCPMVATHHHSVEVHYTGEFTIANSCPSDLALQKTGGYRFVDGFFSVMLHPHFQGMEPPGIPGRFILCPASLFRTASLECWITPYPTPRHAAFRSHRGRALGLGLRAYAALGTQRRPLRSRHRRRGPPRPTPWPPAQRAVRYS